MKDKGKVISTEGEFARVEVACLEACQGCAARSLCIGHTNTKGLLSVRNPLQAKEGDVVLIAIPEARYSKALILFFGVLICAALAGMGLGYFFSLIFPLFSSESSVAGVFFGVAIAGFWLFKRFKKVNNKSLYPEITAIMPKGG